MTNRSEFIKLQLASFISQIGSHFMTLSLSAYVYSLTHSPAKASIIFVLSYLPSVFVSSRFGQLIDQHLSKKLLVCTETAGILTSILCGLLVGSGLQMLALGVVLSIRSMLLFSSRTSLQKWIRQISPVELLGSRVKLSFLAFFLSTAISGVMAGFVLAAGSIWSIVVIDVATYIIGISVLLFLNEDSIIIEKEKPQIILPKQQRILAVLSAIFSDDGLRKPFLIVCISQAVFQGAYSVLVTYLPVSQHFLGQSGVGYFQLATSVGIILGFIVLWRRPMLYQAETGRHLLLLTWATAFSAIILSVNAGLAGSLIGFCVFNLSYECLWLSSNTEFFQKSPQKRLAEYQFTLSSTASFMMAAATLAYAIAIQELGSFLGITVIATLCLILIGSIRFLKQRTVVLMGGLR